MLAQWLAEHGYHNLAKCNACAVRLDCFQVFLHALYDPERLDEANFACFGILADGIRVESRKVAALGGNDAACIKAICTILDLAIPIETLQELFEASFFVPTVARVQNLSLLESVLAVVSDVDTVTN
jgi:hypothetical protein